jgi:hypothetical protein
MIPEHHQKKFANQELMWYPYDDEESYQKNLLTRNVELSRLGWIDKKITYKFNSAGHRSDEFQDGSVVFLGCSITFGIGLPLECTYPTIISAALDLPCANLAVTGSSSDTAFRLAEYWLPKLKPKIVIMMSPDKSRIELLDNQPTNLRANTGTLNNLFYQKWLLYEENSRLNQLKNILAIKSICSELSIKFLPFTVENDFCFIESDLARDLSHPGRLSHIKTAKKILSTIKGIV